jgi:hypothetical protein
VKWLRSVLAHLVPFAKIEPTPTTHHDRIVAKADRVIPRVRNLRIVVGFQEADRAAFRRPR